MTHRRSPRTAGLAACGVALALLAAPLPAAAQRVIISTSNTLQSPVTTALWADTGYEPEWVVPGGVVDPLFTSDGRYLLGRILTASSTYFLRALDLQTNEVVDFPFDFTPVVAHPVRAEIYGRVAPGTVARIDLGGLQTITTGCAPGATTSFDLSADGDALMTLCDSGQLLVLDAVSGAIRSSVSLGGAGSVVEVVAGERAGTAVVSRVQPASREGYELIATATGAVLASFGTAASPAGERLPCGTARVMGASRDRQLIAVTCAWTAPGAAAPVYRSYELDVARRAWVAQLRMDEAPIGLSFSADRFTIFAAGVGTDSTGRIYRFGAHDGRPSSIVLDVHTHAMSMAFPPLAPQLSATVVGTTLHLTWTMAGTPFSPPVDDWEVEAWSDPEPMRLGSVVVRDRQGLTLERVPPGTYAVFVSGRNTAGLGRQSNILTVTVPAIP